MSDTLQELASFTQFAQQQLGRGEAALSLEECVRLWRQQTERQAVLADVQQGEVDLDAGLSQPLAAAFNDVRRQVGLLR